MRHRRFVTWTIASIATLTVACGYCTWGSAANAQELSGVVVDEKDDAPKPESEPDDEQDPFADEKPFGETSKKDAKGKEKDEEELSGEALKAHKREVKAVANDLHKTKNRESVRMKISRIGTSAKRAERDALIKFATKNKNHEFVKLSFDALATIGGKTVIDFLCSKDGLQHKSFLIALSGAEALGSTKDERAGSTLLKVMLGRRTKIEVQSACAIAVAKCAPNDKDVIQALFKQSRHKKDTIRANTLEALGYLRSDAAVERLKEALFNDKNTRARAASATGLGWTYRKEVIIDLEQSIQSESSLEVKQAASSAIQSIQRGKPRD